MVIAKEGLSRYYDRMDHYSWGSSLVQVDSDPFRVILDLPASDSTLYGQIRPVLSRFSNRMWLTITMQEDEGILLIFGFEKQPKQAEMIHYLHNKGKDGYFMPNKPENSHNYLIKTNSYIYIYIYIYVNGNILQSNCY